MGHLFGRLSHIWLTDHFVPYWHLGLLQLYVFDLGCRYEEPIAEEDDYSRANSWQSGDSIRSTRSSDGGDVSTADGESNSAPKADKRQRFADHRKDHYDMRNALQK